MDVLQMAVSSLGTFYNLEVSPEQVKGKKYNKDYFMNTSAALIGSLGSVVAAWHQIRNDKEPIASNQDSTYAEYSLCPIPHTTFLALRVSSSQGLISSLLSIFESIDTTFSLAPP